MLSNSLRLVGASEKDFKELEDAINSISVSGKEESAKPSSVVINKPV